MFLYNFAILSLYNLLNLILIAKELHILTPTTEIHVCFTLILNLCCNKIKLPPMKYVGKS